MAKLIYVTPASLDGYLARDHYDWCVPTDEALTFMTNAMRPVGTYLYGRRMFETMAVWETPDLMPGLQTPVTLEFARLWQSAGKIVYSRTLNAASTKKTRFERTFDPQAIREMKVNLPHDFSIGGSNLAAQAIRAGIVDEYQFFVVPMTIGSGIPVMPTDVHVKLELVSERRFGDGWLHLHYRTPAK